MGCCGDKRSAQKQGLSISSSGTGGESRGPGGGLHYTGSGPANFRGAVSGRMYSFGGRAAPPVDPRDEPGLLSTGSFVRT
jgi:hypothetical protein